MYYFCLNTLLLKCTYNCHEFDVLFCHSSGQSRHFPDLKKMHFWGIAPDGSPLWLSDLVGFLAFQSHFLWSNS